MIILQFTGLFGSGKSTLARCVAEKLIKDNYPVEILDGDIYRKGLCKDLSFSKEDRIENIRRLGFVVGTLVKNNVISIIAAINPYECISQEIKDKYNNVYTIWINCNISELKKRDTKNLYFRAALPEGYPDRINNLTGINDSYEIPEKTDLMINTTELSIENSVSILYTFIEQKLNKRNLET